MTDATPDRAASFGDAVVDIARRALRICSTPNPGKPSIRCTLPRGHRGPHTASYEDGDQVWTLSDAEARALDLCPLCGGYGGCNCSDPGDEQHQLGDCPVGDVCPRCGDEGGYHPHIEAARS